MVRIRERSGGEGSTNLRMPTPVVGAAVFLSLGVPDVALSQMKSPPGGTTPSGAIFDRLNGATTRPVPQVPPPAVRAPDMTWVPDRTVQIPGTDGPVMVPGFFFNDTATTEIYTPPLIGRTPSGDIIQFPAGTQPPVGE